MYLLLTLGLQLSQFAHAQNVSITPADTFCKVEMFSAKMGKAPTPAFKRCDGLKDKTESKVASYEACKQHALDKATECMNTLKIDEIAVKGKFIEKLSVSQNSTTFTCELGKSGVSSCP